VPLDRWSKDYNGLNDVIVRNDAMDAVSLLVVGRQASWEPESLRHKECQ